MSIESYQISLNNHKKDLENLIYVRDVVVPELSKIPYNLEEEYKQSILNGDTTEKLIKLKKDIIEYNKKFVSLTNEKNNIMGKNNPVNISTLIESKIRSIKNITSQIEDEKIKFVDYHILHREHCLHVKNGLM